MLSSEGERDSPGWFFRDESAWEAVPPAPFVSCLFLFPLLFLLRVHDRKYTKEIGITMNALARCKRWDSGLGGIGGIESMVTRVKVERVRIV